jgi:hypothetical protein
MKSAIIFGGCQAAMVLVALASGCGSSNQDKSGNGTGGGTFLTLSGGNGTYGSGSYLGGTRVLTGNEAANLRNQACTGWSREPELAPAMLQFVIDKSTSMNDSAPSTGTQSKWEATRDALLATYPTLSPSLGVGQFFFPNVQRTVGGSTAGCVDPNGGMAVDIALLTTQQINALMAGVRAVPNPTTPTGTPTHDAWREGLRRLQAALANPGPGLGGARGYVVLMTDGMPVRALNCAAPLGGATAVNEVQFDELIEDVRSTTATTGLETFVIGVPGSENVDQVPWEPGSNDTLRDYIPREKLAELAVAGETAPAGCSTVGPNYCHIDMTTGSDFGPALQAQLTAIAGQISACTYSLPPPPTGERIDPNAVNAILTTSGGQAVLILRSSSASCKEGWYYSPDGTKINLCSGTCDQVKADSGASFELLFGCATISVTE